MKRSLRFVGVSVMMVAALLVLGVGVALAIPLSNTPITNLQFTTAACGGLFASLTVPFMYDPLPDPDGTVASAVYQGCATGGTRNTYAISPPITAIPALGRASGGLWA